MLVLFESAAGYAIFKLLDEKKLKKVDQLYESFDTAEKANSIVKLKHFKKFKDTTEALEAAVSSIEGKMSKSLKKLLKKLFVEETQETLAVADAKLGNVIKDKFNIQCIADSNIQELMRCIRSQTEELITGLPQQEMSAMALGLAHSLSRYKLKFSPDKVDTMIVQAVGLLDDLDKELNNYVMRTREWYGWHFPEMGKIIQDNNLFVRTIKTMGFRTNASTVDLSGVLPEEMEAELKSAAEISMGSEISDEDILQIKELCEEVISLSDYRAQLFDYLKNRMTAIAPNTTCLLGELVGARLIAHAGSLLNLAKHPASTVQILGAEKALFRALKTKHDTPKYGLIYHAAMVGQANQKNKGKISRMLAAKASLAIRVDALGEDGNVAIGIDSRAKLERQMKFMDEGYARKSTGKIRPPQQDSYDNKSFFKSNDEMIKDASSAKKRKRDETEEQADADESTPVKKIKKIKSEEATEDSTSAKKKKKEKSEEPTDPSTEGSASAKKKKKVKSEEQADPSTEDSSSAKKKKKVKSEEQAEPSTEESSSAKKKKKVKE